MPHCENSRGDPAFFRHAERVALANTSDAPRRALMMRVAGAVRRCIGASGSGAVGTTALLRHPKPRRPLGTPAGWLSRRCQKGVGVFKKEWLGAGGISGCRMGQDLDRDSVSAMRLSAEVAHWTASKSPDDHRRGNRSMICPGVIIRKSSGPCTWYRCHSFSLARESALRCAGVLAAPVLGLPRFFGAEGRQGSSAV